MSAAAAPICVAAPRRLGFLGTEKRRVVRSQQERFQNPLCARPKVDHPAAAMMGGFVIAGRGDPDASAAIDVARAEPHQFAGTRRGQELQLNQRPDLAADERFDGLDRIARHGFDRVGFLRRAAPAF